MTKLTKKRFLVWLVVLDISLIGYYYPTILPGRMPLLLMVLVMIGYKINEAAALKKEANAVKGDRP